MFIMILLSFSSQLYFKLPDVEVIISISLKFLTLPNRAESDSV